MMANGTDNQHSGSGNAARQALPGLAGGHHHAAGTYRNRLRNPRFLPRRAVPQVHQPGSGDRLAGQTRRRRGGNRLHPGIDQRHPDLPRARAAQAPEPARRRRRVCPPAGRRAACAAKTAHGRAPAKTGRPARLQRAPASARSQHHAAERNPAPGARPDDARAGRQAERSRPACLRHCRTQRTAERGARIRQSRGNRANPLCAAGAGCAEAGASGANPGHPRHHGRRTGPGRRTGFRGLARHLVRSQQAGRAVPRTARRHRAAHRAIVRLCLRPQQQPLRPRRHRPCLPQRAAGCAGAGARAPGGLCHAARRAVRPARPAVCRVAGLVAGLAGRSRTPAAPLARSRSPSPPRRARCRGTRAAGASRAGCRAVARHPQPADRLAAGLFPRPAGRRPPLRRHRWAARIRRRQRPAGSCRPGPRPAGAAVRAPAASP